MLKLSGNDEMNAEQEKIQEEKEDKIKTRINYLEISIRDEKDQISVLKNKLKKIKEDFIVACILIGICMIMLIYLFFNAFPLATALIQSPMYGIAILGIMVSFISYSVRFSIKTIPMYIWCEQENKGKMVTRDNYASQCKIHERECRKMEEELATYR